MTRRDVLSLSPLSLLAAAAGFWHSHVETYFAKRRRVVAAAFSLGLHGLLIAFLTLGIASHVSGGGAGGVSYGTGTGIGVELVSMREAAPDALMVKAPVSADPADSDDVTTSQLSTDAVETDVLDAPDSQKIIQVSDTTIISHSGQITPEQASAGGPGQGGQSSGVDDTLWKQIEPCWRRIAGPGKHDVMLRVSFSPLGNIAHTSSAPDVQAISDTQSETEAVEALAQCGPYVSAGSREDVMIAFPAFSGNTP